MPSRCSPLPRSRCPPRAREKPAAKIASRCRPGESVVSESVELVWYGEDAPWYDHGPEHPLRPARVILTHRLIEEYGLLRPDSVRLTTARDASDEELRLVHTERYLR